MALTVVSFVLVMSVLVFVHELGHLLVAKRSKIVVEEFGFGYPPRVLKLFERDGTLYSINAIPFGGFCRMRGEDDPSQPGSFASASKTARALTLLAGAGMNFLLAILLFAGLALLNGVPDATRPGAVVTSISPGSPAELAGLQVDDRIIAADGAPLNGLADLQNHARQHAGQPVRYQVVRGAQTLDVTMTPRTAPPAGQGPLGVGVTQLYRRAWLPEALWQGVVGTAEVIAVTFAVPATLIREGRPISDAGFMGPVGIAAATGQVVRSAITIESVQPVIWFMGLLSAALGITNLLPIPALDGGRLLFIAIEMVTRKRVRPEREGLVHLVGFGLLLALVGVVTVREISSLITGNFPSLGLP
jgi:regulator of sigma E protease